MSRKIGEKIGIQEIYLNAKSAEKKEKERRGYN